MLVYYLEAPYGNLIGVPFGQPEARTQVKGNLFSFSMPWEDIERCCREASQHADEMHGDRLMMPQESLGLPHWATFRGNVSDAGERAHRGG